MLDQLLKQGFFAGRSNLANAFRKNFGNGRTFGFYISRGRGPKLLLLILLPVLAILAVFFFLFLALALVTRSKSLFQARGHMKGGRLNDWLSMQKAAAARARSHEVKGSDLYNYPKDGPVQVYERSSKT